MNVSNCIVEPRDIIDAWDSAAQLARDISQSDVTVRAWRRRNGIPGKKWLPVAQAAEKRGMPHITVDVIARAHALTGVEA